MNLSKAVHRLLAETQVTDPPNNNKNYQWQREMKQGYKGKARKPDQVLPEGTYTKSASEIAHVLKQHSTDYKQAMSKLSGYINSQGRNLQGGDKARLYDAKNALRQAYGQPAETASAGYPLYALPPGHNLDDPVGGGLGILEDQLKDLQMPNDKLSIKAALRLVEVEKLEASIYNSLQNPGNSTSIGSVEVEADKWIKDVKPEHGVVPEGTFTKSADHIAKTLKRASDSEAKAMERLNFYVNRQGGNASAKDKSKYEKAKEILKGLYK